MVAMIGGAMAKTASNSFAEVSGEGVESDGEMGFVIKNVAGDVVITISERDGWKSEKESPYTYTHKEGDTDNFYFAGREGEESVTVPISNIWECAHNTTNNCPHDVDPGFKVTTNEHAILMYAYPEKGCEIIPGADFEPVKGSHVLKVFEVPCPNPKCDFGKGDNPISSEIVEVEPSLKVETFVNDPDKKGIKVGDKTLYPHGTYTGGFSVTNDNKKCSDCCADASGKTKFDVCEARLSAAEYIGLDRTDAGYACEQFMTANVYLENAVGKPGFAWTTGANCMISGDSDKSDAKIAVKRKSENVPGGKGFEHSKNYRQEKLSCNASLSDGHGSSCEANVTLEGSYTVVKVDVQIEGTTELQEEERGAYTYYVPDGDSPLWQEEWTNSLKKVTITCEPSDGVMAAQTVDIKFTEHQLWVKAEDGTYEEAKNSYTVNELNKTTFYLHGHKKSEKYKGEKIVATHNNSGATDQAFYTVFGRPWLVPDYDRKNGIDDKDNDGDVAKSKGGKIPFRFWINDDDDSDESGVEMEGIFPVWHQNGSINEGSNNQPGKGNNHHDNKINGYSDLLDFSAMLVDTSDVFPGGTPDDIKDNISWYFHSDAVNIVFTGLEQSEVPKYHTTDLECYGDSLDQNVYEAAVSDISVEIPAEDKFQELLRMRKKGIILFEGCGKGRCLRIKGKTNLGFEICVGSVLLSISPVEEMYRWLDLRSAGAELLGASHKTCKCAETFCNGMNEPSNNPDSSCNGCPRDGKHIVFVHGYNINANEARAWGAEMFKRLWQSGSSSLFTVVDWVGDAGQFGNPDDAYSVSYYFAVPNAFLAAQELQKAVDEASFKGNPVIMAHSLGNMVVSSAIVDWNMHYTKYYLLNAAVAIQAYEERTDYLMINEDWRKIKEDFFASYWHRLFKPDDFRSKLNWKGRFGKIDRTVNYYSASDHIIHNEYNDLFMSRPSFSPWTLQERKKGKIEMRIADLISNQFSNSGDEKHLGTEAGWGFNVARVGILGFFTNPNSSVNDISFEEIVKEPVFYPFKSEAAKMNSPNLFEYHKDDSQQYILRAKLLGSAIPATSFAAGANALREITSINYTAHEGKKWPRRNSYWYHSDLKNVAFFFNKSFFDEIVKGRN